MSGMPITQANRIQCPLFAHSKHQPAYVLILTTASGDQPENRPAAARKNHQNKETVLNLGKMPQ